VDDRCIRVASSLSFTTLLALVPLTAVAVAVLSLFPVFSTWMSVIQDFIYSNFVPAAGEAVQKHLMQFAGKTGRLTAVGLVFLVVTAIMLLATIEQALNDIWRVANTRKLVHRFLAYWALLTLGPLLVAASLSLTTHLVALPFIDRAVAGVFARVIGGVLPLLFGLGAVVLLYTVVPNTPVRWRHALAGAVVAVLLLEIAKWLFAASMKYFFASYQIVYGAIAVLPIFLVWIYISWLIVLLGAVVAATLTGWSSGAARHRRGETA
jgi:membrane protein